MQVGPDDRDIQQQIMLAVSEERIKVANVVIEESEGDMTTLCTKADDIMIDTLNSLASEGALPVKEGKGLSQHFTEQNTAILKKVSDIKNKQFRQLNERMIEKRRRKHAMLKEKQETEKKEVKYFLEVKVIYCDLLCIIIGTR